MVVPYKLMTSAYAGTAAPVGEVTVMLGIVCPHHSVGRHDGAPATCTCDPVTRFGDDAAQDDPCI